MAVVGNAQEHWAGQSASYNGGVWTYNRVWLVKVDNKTDREGTVSGATGLPPYGAAHPSPVDAPAHATEIQYDRWDSATPLAWKVTVRYSSARTHDSNPDNDEVLVAWTSEIYQEPIWEDTSGNAILNSAGDYFIDPSPTRDAAHIIAKISANVTSVPAWVLSYQNAVNNAAITIGGLAIPIRTAKMQKLDIGQREKRGVTTFYPLSFEVHVRSEGWRFQPLDAGFRELDGTKRKNIRNDSDGELPTSPVPLNGSGAFLANPTPATAVYGDFTIYPELDFTVLPGVS